MAGKNIGVELGQAAGTKAVEGVVNKALDAVMGFLKKKYGKLCVDMAFAYQTYLVNAWERYNQIKTLANPHEPRTLEGENGIYVETYVEYEEESILVSTVENLTTVSRNIVILGSGGTGKSMMLRHLFLNTMQRGTYIPVMVELRKISEQKLEDLSVLKLVHACMESFDVKLNEDQLKYSLRSGKYLFLFDGLDEVREELREKTGELIQDMSAKYPDNLYIVSSREGGLNFHTLETYTCVKACPLEKEQALELITKIGGRCEKTEEFCKQLDMELYERHRDFAMNPLLLTMMYITFIDNNSIPEHLIDFYENAFQALCNRHDATKGTYQREFKCKGLGKSEFKDLFAYFCFHTYFRQQYEFNKKEMLALISKGIEKFEFNSVLQSPQQFFEDIKNNVCLIVEEGTTYKFSHRSFQTYFAAYYTAALVSDENQRKIFIKEFNDTLVMDIDFYKMLRELEGERFEENVLASGIDYILDGIYRCNNPAFQLLTLYGDIIGVEENKLILYFHFSSYELNILRIFQFLYCQEIKDNKEIAKKCILILHKYPQVYRTITKLSLSSIWRIDCESDRKGVMDLLCKYFNTYNELKEMKFLSKRSKLRRKKMKEESKSEIFFANL